MRRLCLIAALLYPLAAAAEPKKLAVLDLEQLQGLQLDARAFTSRLQNAARRALPGVELISRQNLEVLLKAQNKSLEECQGECIVETGRNVGADYIVGGRISRVGRLFTLSMQLWDTRSGAQLSGEDIEGKSEDELLVELAKAAQRLVQPLARASRGEPAGEGHIGGGSSDVSLGSDDDVVVDFGSEPADAVVTLDGALLCRSTPCRRQIASGSHEARFEREGYEPAAQSFVAKKGTHLSQRLVRLAALVAVETEPPGLQLAIDSKPAGRSPAPPAELAAGPHEIVVDDPCYLRDGERVVLRKGEERTVRIAAKPRLAGVRISAEDERGDALEAAAFARGQPLGPVPGSYKLPLCAGPVEVRKSGYISWSGQPELQENKLARVKAVLRREDDGQVARGSGGQAGSPQSPIPGEADVPDRTPAAVVLPFHAEAGVAISEGDLELLTDLVVPFARHALGDAFRATAAQVAEAGGRGGACDARCALRLAGLMADHVVVGVVAPAEAGSPRLAVELRLFDLHAQIVGTASSDRPLQPSELASETARLARMLFERKRR